MIHLATNLYTTTNHNQAFKGTPMGLSGRPIGHWTKRHPPLLVSPQCQRLPLPLGLGRPHKLGLWVLAAALLLTLPALASSLPPPPPPPLPFLPSIIMAVQVEEDRPPVGAEALASSLRYGQATLVDDGDDNNNKRTASSSGSRLLPEANLEESVSGNRIFNGSSGNSKQYLSGRDNLVPEGVREDELIELLAELFAYKQVLHKQLEHATSEVYMKIAAEKKSKSASGGSDQIHLNHSQNAISKQHEHDAPDDNNNIYANAGHVNANVNHYQDKDEDTNGSSSLLALLRRQKILSMLMADQEGLMTWLRLRQREFPSLKNTTFEFLNEYPTRSINICPDGPKILILPDGKDILYCYTRNQWISKLWSDLRLSAYHYPIIALNIMIFLFGTTGNIFVCLSVYRNLQLRNVTNYFIVNLAFADFLVILICLPATAVWDLTLTWFFGTIPCKLIMFLQDVSISVSVLTLTAISLDRYYAICHPLKFKSSLSQAKRIIVLIWLVSLVIMVPDLIYLSAIESQELSEAGLNTVLYSDCNYNLSPRSSSVFQFAKTILLYLIPLMIMFCAHYVIMQNLRVASTSCQNELRSMKQVVDHPHQQAPGFTGRWGSRAQSQQFHRQHRDGSTIIQLIDRRPNSLELANQSGSELNGVNGCGGGANSKRLSETVCSISNNQQQQSKEVKKNKTATTTIMTIIDDNHNATCSQGSKPTTLNNNGAEEPTMGGRKLLMLTMHHNNRLESRRKAASMLAAIVVIFGICYLPVHLINFLRLFIEDMPQTDVTSTISMLSHCACYLNSAINPIIYNHMNSTFRAEFRKFLSCFCWRRHRGQVDNNNNNNNKQVNNNNKSVMTAQPNQAYKRLVVNRLANEEDIDNNNNINNTETTNLTCQINKNNDDNNSAGETLRPLAATTVNLPEAEVETEAVAISAQSSVESG